MRIRSFIIAYALLLAILLFADRRPNPALQQNRYSHIVDLTVASNSGTEHPSMSLRTQIIAPDAMIPGTWTAGQIPPERLIAPLVVMDLNVAPPAQISLDDVATWETDHGAIPPGAVVAIRNKNAPATSSNASLPITDDAAQFLMEARYTLGFAMESAADMKTDRALARQLALHGDFVVQKTAPLSTIPCTGSLIVVAPDKDKHAGTAPVRVLAMVR
jgi:kynurenine formamidase